jgi:hypothetical protein
MTDSIISTTRHIPSWRFRLLGWKFGGRGIGLGTLAAAYQTAYSTSMPASHPPGRRAQGSASEEEIILAEAAAGER